MGEAKRKKETIAKQMRSTGGLGATAVEDVILPTQVLQSFQAAWPNVWQTFGDVKTHYSRKSSMHVRAWCALPVDFAISALDMLHKEGKCQRKEMMSLDFEGALGSALEAWRDERKVFVVDQSEHGPLGSTSFPMPKSGLDFLLLGRSAIYIATPGLNLVGGACQGVMAGLDDRVEPDGTHLPPMLNLIPMYTINGNPAMQSMAANGTFAGLKVIPIPTQIPLCDGDLFEAFFAEHQSNTQRMEDGPIEMQLAANEELLRNAERLTSQGETSTGLEDLVRQIKDSPTDTEGMTRQLMRSTFNSAEKLASLVWMAISGKYQMTLAAALDSPFGEVRLIGGRKTKPEGEEAATTPQNPAEQEIPDVGSATPIWRYSGVSVDVENLLANAPWAIQSAKEAFLYHGDNGLGVVLPPSELAVADVIENVKRQFGEDLEVSLASPQGFGALCASLGDKESGKGTFDSVIITPVGQEPWRVALMTTDSTNQYVSAVRVLHALGEFAVMSGSGIPRVSKFVNDMTCFLEAMSVVWSLEKVRNHYGNDHNALGQAPVRIVAGYFGAYVLAYFLGIDPRTVSYGMVREEKLTPMLAGMISSFMPDLRYVVAFPGALGAFLEAKIGVTRAIWNAGKPAQRVKWVADGAKSLLAYMDDPATNRAEGGIKWLPDADIAKLKVPSGGDKGNPLFDTMRVIFDATEQSLPDMLALGVLPTILTAFHQRANGIGAGETLVPAMHGGNEDDFIKRKLAQLDCLFVLRQSEVWIGGEHERRREEGVSIRFFSLHGNAHGTYKLRRNPLDFEKMPFVVEGSHEDRAVFNS